MNFLDISVRSLDSACGYSELSWALQDLRDQAGQPFTHVQTKFLAKAFPESDAFQLWKGLSEANRFSLLMDYIRYEIAAEDSSIPQAELKGQLDQVSKSVNLPDATRAVASEAATLIAESAGKLSSLQKKFDEATEMLSEWVQISSSVIDVQCEYSVVTAKFLADKAGMAKYSDTTYVSRDQSKPQISHAPKVAKPAAAKNESWGAQTKRELGEITPQFGYELVWSDMRLRSFHIRKGFEVILGYVCRGVPVEDSIKQAIRSGERLHLRETSKYFHKAEWT